MIGISSSWLAIRGMSIKESIEKGFELGFDLVELGAAHKCEENAIETVMKLRKKYPDKQFTLHALFPPFKNKNGNYPLNLADPKEHDRTIKVVTVKGEKKLVIDYVHCKGCLICVEVCPHGALSKEREE